MVGCCSLEYWRRLPNSMRRHSSVRAARQSCWYPCAPETAGAFISAYVRPSWSCPKSKVPLVSMDILSRPYALRYSCSSRRMNSVTGSSSLCSAWRNSCAARTRLVGSKRFCSTSVAEVNVSRSARVNRFHSCSARFRR